MMHNKHDFLTKPDSPGEKCRVGTSNRPSKLYVVVYKLPGGTWQPTRRVELSKAEVELVVGQFTAEQERNGSAARHKVKYGWRIYRAGTKSTKKGGK